jgi:endonuclease/exonuclease/phosphatase family metal-dependent hydrolase
VAFDRLLDALARLLPPPWPRAIRGLVGPRAVLVDELPPTRRPGALALFEAAAGLGPVGSELAILSYNLQRAVRLTEVAASLAHAVADHRPELVLLQEMPQELLDHPAFAPALAGRSLFYAPFHQVDCPDRRYPYRRYGQLTASACRLEAAEVVELPTVNPAGLGPGHILKRIALYCELPSAAGPRLGLLNLHLEPFARRHGRLPQYEAIAAAIDDRAAEVVVCCGDFNPSLGQHGEPGLELLAAHGFVNAFAHRWRALDTCLARGHAGFLEARALPLGGSDHRPVLVRMRLQPRPEAGALRAGARARAARSSRGAAARRRRARAAAAAARWRR